MSILFETRPPTAGGPLDGVVDWGAAAFPAVGRKPVRDSAARSRHEEFERVVGPRLERLRRLARKILRSEDLADDAVQEALVSLWRQGDLPPNPEGWLVRAVVHRSLHLNRGRQRRRKHEERASRGRAEHDPSGDASKSLETAETLGAFAAALNGLPQHLRVVFLLRENDGMDYSAIAVTLNVPVGTVRSRLFRSREAIKAAVIGSKP